MTAEPWTLAQSGQFCLTLSAGRSVEDVLEAYGADTARARWLTSEEWFGIYEPSATSTALRAGSLGNWSFCIEFENCIGFTPGIRRALSKETEAFILSRTGHALTTLHYMTDGELVESFEPGNDTPSAPSGRDFAGRVQRLTDSADGVTACLEVLAEYTGRYLTTSLLHGPLLSVTVPDPDRAGLMRADLSRTEGTTASGTSSGLGRRLGTIGQHAP
ncbi:DUF6461 domain-containing protein [Streptomyces liliiviolaceus]|uniref:DUF6461 domain-containing protein n=1 Tax=Streptomyces liliiviolaceus TaxID=2823109 RepID=UPI00389B13F6